MSKGQQISENFYVRGDGTVSESPMNIFCKDIQYIINIFIQQYANFKWLHETTQHMFFLQRAYYFSNEYLVDLFSKCGFTLEEICVHNKQVKNRSLELVMNR
jgi:methyltransferase-like protein 6